MVGRTDFIAGMDVMGENGTGEITFMELLAAQYDNLSSTHNQSSDFLSVARPILKREQIHYKPVRAKVYDL